MNTSPPPDLQSQVTTTLEFWAKLLGLFGALYLFLERIGKPFLKWRRAALEKSIREALHEELAVISDVQNTQAEIHRLLQEILAGQTESFADFDLLVDVAEDNRERHDEIRDLLVEAGIKSPERRSGRDRRQNADHAWETLQARRRERRRPTIVHREPEVGEDI